MIRLGLTLAVLALDVWAITSILESPGRLRRKLGWISAVVVLPVIGAIGWLRAGVKRQGAHEGHSNPGGR